MSPKVADLKARNFVNKGLFYLIFSKVENLCPYFRVMLNLVLRNFISDKSAGEKDNYFKVLKGRYFLLGDSEDIIFDQCLTFRNTF